MPVGGVRSADGLGSSHPDSPTRASRAVPAGGAALGGLLLVLVRARAGVATEPAGLEVVAQLLGATSLLLRRAAVALVLCLALSLLSPVVATAVALYLVGRWVETRRTAWGALALALAMVVPVWAVTAYRSGVSVPLALVLGTVVPWLAGRAQRATARAARAQALREESARREAADRVRSLERSRLAAELHDAVANRFSLVVLQANLLETTSRDAAARTAAGEIREIARAALAEVREVLRLIREPGADPAVQDALADIAGYVAQARDVGQPVTAVVTATHREPPDRVERTAVRVVREGLTNAVRHAPGAPTRVLVEESAAGVVRARVANEPPSAPPTGLTTGGTGLLGLRERVALLGGTLASGSTPDGGYLLEATVPRDTR